jgi:quercetin dioxygenase-like cupin family protein
MTSAPVVALADQVSYQAGSVVSRRVLSGAGGNVTLFAFAAGEGLAEHTSPFAAMVVVLDGEAVIRVGGEERLVAAGQAIQLPAGVPHALDARNPFKMMLIMIRADG